MNIVLIGYRGTGKSTIGKHLAALLHMPFVDTDTLITQRAGRTIKEIFESQGEPAFRDLESAVIREVAAQSNTIIAAGGGVILRPENVAVLKSTGKIIWLQADPQTLHNRILADSATAATRPNLTTLGGGGGGLEEIKSILQHRLPLYTAAAHATLDISTLSVEEAAARIQALIAQNT